MSDDADIPPPPVPDPDAATGAGTPPVPDADAATTAAGTAGSSPPQPSGWPGAAKGGMVVLALIAIGAVIAAIVGFSQASSSDDDATAAEDDLAAAVARADEAEQELAALEDDLADLESVEEDLASTTAELETATAERDAAVEENERLSAELETTNAELASLEEQLTAVSEQFPFGLDSSLIPDDMPGEYDITYQEAYCEGLPTCGTVPSGTRARIYWTDEQFLRMEVPGVLDAGLFALEGSLYGITDSLTALEPCGGAERRARITVTLYADSISVNNVEGELVRTVDDVNASITIDAPANGPECPSVLVFYASNLVPVG